jgi:hypothetical protein
MRKQTRLALGTAFMLCTMVHHVAMAAFSEDVRQTMRQLVDTKIEPALVESGLPKGKTISVLPIAGDEGQVVEGLLKQALRQAGLNCVEGKNDPFWDEILSEVEWSERKGDMLEADTLTSFGRLKGTQILVYGVLREASASGRRVFVELELHISSIETKDHLWGDMFAERVYKDEGMVGIVEIDDAVRQVLTEAFAKGQDSLQAAGAKLAGIDTAILVPLAGDVDRYVTGLTEQLLATSPVTPKSINAQTIGEAERLLRDDPSQADAIVYGSVRDLSREMKNRHYFRGGHFIVIDHEVRAEVQLKLRKAGTGEVPWSATFAATGMDAEAVTWSDLIYEHPSEAIKLALGVAGVLLLLIVLGMFLRSTRRVR